MGLLTALGCPAEFTPIRSYKTPTGRATPKGTKPLISLFGTFFGEIIDAGINFAGSFHDSKVFASFGLYNPKLGDEMTPRGFAILVDSAFPSSASVLNGKIIRTRKVNKIPSGSGIDEGAYGAATELLLDRAMPSERQNAERSVRAIEGP